MFYKRMGIVDPVVPVQFCFVLLDSYLLCSTLLSSTLHCFVVFTDALLCTVLLCSYLLCSAQFLSALFSYALFCTTLLCSALLFFALICSVLFFYSLLFSSRLLTALHFTVQLYSSSIRFCPVLSCVCFFWGRGRYSAGKGNKLHCTYLKTARGLVTTELAFFE